MGRYHRRGVGRRDYVGTHRQECDYHQCRQPIGQMRQCPHCHKTFCEYHLSPKPTSVISISDASYEEIQNWRKDNAHPCFAFVEYYHRMKGQELDAAKEALDKMKHSSGAGERDNHSEATYSATSSIHYWSKKLFQLILFPFIWVYKTILSLIDFLIVKPARWLFEEASSFLYHLTKGVRHVISAIWALVKIAFFLAIVYFVLSYIWNSGVLTKGVAALENIKMPAFIGKNCTATLMSGSCSTVKPIYCDDGKYVRRADICGCDPAYRVSGSECIQKINCSDGTLWPDCSVNKPYQCDRGNLIENATLCSCPDDYIQNGDSCKQIQRCIDKTIYGQCSQNRPLYCSDGTLIQRASICGCPDNDNYQLTGDTCRFISPQEKMDIQMSTTEQESRGVVDYINQLRKENGKTEITWDKRAYLLGLARTKDMYTNKYMDHVSPSGQCTDNMKTQFGFTTEILPENAWGETYSYTEGGIYNYLSSKPNINSAIDSWMTSKGHRYNLLYDDHVGGAVSCYGSSCVFIGVQPGPYGLGAGGCHSAAEGEAYWQTH